MVSLGAFKNFIDESLNDVDVFIKGVQNLDTYKSLSDEDKKLFKEGLELIKDCKDKDCKDGDCYKKDDKGNPIPIPLYTGTHVANPGYTPKIIVFSQDGSWLARTVDILSGWYGYDHVAVDVGEVDQDTGEPLMFEATLRTHEVTRNFQHIYDYRTGYIIDLSDKIVGTSSEFYNDVIGMNTEPYDIVELITFGLINDPKKQVCSDLATRNFQPDIINDIIKQYEEGRLPYLSVINWQSRFPKKESLISPNAYAKYFGLDKLPWDQDKQGLIHWNSQ